MEPCNELEHCKKQFDLLFEKLDKLDLAIRGNGKPGITVRLDRLEQAGKVHTRLIWVLLGAALAALIQYLLR
ncbi:MAG: hypothetical protein KAS17_05020 [Victivallaceae bacterium]|nr:hypothetical protein [Victivallaceae bacterium]